MLINAFTQMSQNAQAVSQAAYNPAIDEERKRQARMAVVTQQIGQQLQYEKFGDQRAQVSDILEAKKAKERLMNILQSLAT